MFVQTENWRDYDPFHAQKLDVFRKSGNSIYRIATMMHELIKEKVTIEANPDNLKVFFQEMIQMCLWGNATDLSLLTHMSLADIERLQTVEKEAQTARQTFIMRDDQEAAWNQLKDTVNGRVDFVLDNSGFELFTDLVFADWLVTSTPYVSEVVFHPKLIPWFVSDVTPPDFAETIANLSDPAFLQSSPTPEQKEHLDELTRRLKQYVESGVFSMSVPLETPLGGGNLGNGANFWTSPAPYWDMKTYDRKLWEDLRESSLVIFKGDLNYRKLTGDIQWPAWTPFTEALGPLAGSFPLLSLRTNKADVAVGLDKDKVKEIEEKDSKWRVNGKFALISFSARQ
ncbi:Hairy/enhancer-of-split with YRPW motif protein 2 [Stygiomarasmius scandens]|uniref:Sugar phosphate phosphatase n=1 Tax=Marasmiellus scandens TaxID=2682957 RepID=A0ABR1ISS1_9AGAR